MHQHVLSRVALVIVSLLAACGVAPVVTTTSPTTTTAPTATASTRAVIPTETTTSHETSAPSTAVAFPVSIEHKYGTTTIPEAPKRVLALGYSEQDAILALGVTPVAVRYWFGDETKAAFPWAQDELGAAEPEVLNMPFGELNFEKIAALQPDLISGVYTGLTEQEYVTLSKIAPTIAQSSNYVDFGTPWQEMTKTIGRALGRAQQAETLVAEVDIVHSRSPGASRVGWQKCDRRCSEWRRLVWLRRLTGPSLARLHEPGICGSCRVR